MSAYQIINADSLTLLKDVEDESVDLIVTDPPTLLWRSTGPWVRPHV